MHFATTKESGAEFVRHSFVMLNLLHTVEIEFLGLVSDYFLNNGCCTQLRITKCSFDEETHFYDVHVCNFTPN